MNYIIEEICPQKKDAMSVTTAGMTMVDNQDVFL